MACEKCRGIADLPLEFFDPPLRHGRRNDYWGDKPKEVQYSDDKDAFVKLSDVPEESRPAIDTEGAPEGYGRMISEQPFHEITYTHWHDATSLQESAKNGCPGCSLILQCLIQKSSRYDEPPSEQDKVDNLKALLSGPAAPIQLTSLNTAFNSIVDWYYRMNINFEPNELIRHLRVACATATEDGELEFFVKHEERHNIPQWFAAICGREVFDRSDSERCFGLAKEWLQNCLENHPSCCSFSSLEAPVLPTRILDVALDDGGDAIRLVETSDGQRGRYASLSHCWGTSPGPLTTQIGTLQDRLSAIQRKDLPQTFQDAVTITRSLNLRYLWIDSLCIIQDSEDDWSKEACLMAKVYSNSHISISALASSNSHTGIFRNRPSGPILELDVRDSETQTTGHIYLRKSALPTITSSYGFLKGPLEERAWVLQERIMAPRILKYGKEQMFWECQEGILLESRAEATPTMLRRTGDRPTDIDIKAWKNHLRRAKTIETSSDGVPGVTPTADVSRADTDKTLIPNDEKGSALITTVDRALEKLKISLGVDSRDQNSYDTEKSEELRSTYDLWYTIINEYSRRKLTKDTDKLPAIAALAEEFATITGDTYLSGFWKSDLLNALLWRIDNDAWHGDEAKGRKPRRSRAPTWSWASIDGWLYTGRKKGHVRIRNTDLDAQILNVETFPTDWKEESFAFNKCSKLTVLARILESDCVLKRTSYGSEMNFPTQSKSWFLERSTLSVHLDIEPWTTSQGLSTSVFREQESHGRVMLLLLGIWGTERDWEWRGMILAKKDWGEEYQRIGVFAISCGKKKINMELAKWKKREIVIV